MVDHIYKHGRTQVCVILTNRVLLQIQCLKDVCSTTISEIDNIFETPLTLTLQPLLKLWPMTPIFLLVF